MSTAADIAAMKCALLKKMQREIAELELTVEQKKQEEAAAERARKVAEEVVRKQREVEEFTQRENKANEVYWVREAEAADKGKKQGREESIEVTVGSMLEENGVIWRLKEG
jgi:hypothetical protein